MHLADKSGDYPLHYAAKYGHLECCKYLVEKGAPVHLRNKAGQSAYDVADSHLVRQYLLPLLLVAERNNGVVPQDYTPYGVPQPGPQTYHAPPGPPPPMAPLPSNSYNQQAAPSNNYPQPPYYPAPAAFSAPPSVPMAAAPPAPMPAAAVASSSSTYSSHSSSSNSNGRFIAPGNDLRCSLTFSLTDPLPADGFHSSASDPVLQQKYGHIIERPSIAPPPTSFPTQPYATPSGPPPTVYQRYVPYDPHGNAPAPFPPALAHPAPAPVAPYAPAPQKPVSPNPTNRLLGNMAIPAGDLLQLDSGTVDIFNPHTDSPVTIINAQASSSAIL